MASDVKKGIGLGFGGCIGIVVFTITLIIIGSVMFRTHLIIAP